MKINEVAKLTGVTVRTLHYYDQIDLLNPNGISEAGYRLYNQDDIKVLQQILFFKELDFPLTEIKEIMKNPKYNENEALCKHKEILLEKRNRLNDLIGLVGNIMNGEKKMSFKEFDITKIEDMKNQYSAEVRERWGNTQAYKESKQKTDSFDQEKWGMINDESRLIFKEFSECRGESPKSEKCQNLVEKWQRFISDNFYQCNNEILADLGLMYANDERFTQNIDQNGEGTAELMSKAIVIYCNKNI